MYDIILMGVHLRWHMAVMVMVMAVGCQCLTSLSENNCPDDFDIVNDNTTVSTSELTSFIYENIYSPADEEQMREAFSSGSDEEVRRKMYNL